MTLSEYQWQAYKFAVPSAKTINYMLPGLVGEVGELCSVFAKAVRDEHNEVDTDLALKKELGDVLWFVAGIANEMGWGLDEVAETNLAKLESRQQRGTIQGSGDER